MLTNVGAKATPEEVTAGVEDTWEQVRLMREYWGWTDDADAAQIEAAIRKYANGLVDEVLKYGMRSFSTMNPVWGLTTTAIS